MEASFASNDETISHLVPILHKMTDAVLMMIKIACLLSAPGHRSVDTAATNIAILQSYIRASDARALTCILRTSYCSILFAVAGIWCYVLL